MSGGGSDWLTLSAHNLARFWTHAPRAMGQRIREWDDVWAADAGSPSPYLNSATLLRPLDEDAVDDLAARLSAFYDGGAGGGSWMLWSAWPAPDFTDRGFQLAGNPPLMVLPAGAALPSPPAELRIVAVDDARTLRDFESAFIAGYPMPEVTSAPEPRMYDMRALGGPLRLFVGYVGDEPVTASAAYVDGKTVGIYAVATLPKVRGKGYGAALTARAAQTDPTLPAVLQASDDGQPVYLRLGFQVVARYVLWIRPRTQM
jgi:GNAT superfamily N-acetyltransferase